MGSRRARSGTTMLFVKLYESPALSLSFFLAASADFSCRPLRLKAFRSGFLTFLHTRISSNRPSERRQPRASTCPRPGRQPCDRDRGRDHYRQRDFPGFSFVTQAVGLAEAWSTWLFVGAGSFLFFGALMYAELGAMKPDAGGEYIYVRDAYGPMKVLYAWTTVLYLKPASIATVTTGFVRILGTFSVFSFFSQPVLTAPIAVTEWQLAAIAAAGFISLLNYIGVKKAGEFQPSSRFLKWPYHPGHRHRVLRISRRCGLEQFLDDLRLVPRVASRDLWPRWSPRCGPMMDGSTSHGGWGSAPARAQHSHRAHRRRGHSWARFDVLVNAGVQYVLPASAIAASPRPASDGVALVWALSAPASFRAGMALSRMP